MFKVQLEKGVWLADKEGDHPRTRREAFAKEFKSLGEAFQALADAREFRPFRNAEVVEEMFE